MEGDIFFHLRTLTIPYLTQPILTSITTKNNTGKSFEELEIFEFFYKPYNKNGGE